MQSSASASSTTGIAPGKAHYVVLDGLRGVASLLVVLFHLFEAYAQGTPEKQIINHGYLAVDFFFLLSGFVVAYAYDDRWSKMTQWEFYKRRLIRLQPMIVMGSIIGAILFWFQDYSIFPKVSTATAWHVIFVAVVGFTMIPLPKSADIRGWDEMYPVNGPAWSLFYEYVANVLYAVGLRKLSNRALGVLVAVAAFAVIYLTVILGRGHLIGGWALDPSNIQIGLTRVMFPFFAGVLLMRLGKRIDTSAPFLLTSLLMIAALSLPRLGGTDQPWMNGAYEALCVIVFFPIIVAMGASRKTVDGASLRVARFFGDMSYPLYITHYPLIYIYTGWVVDNHIPPERGAIVGLGVFIATLAIAYASLRFYDLPVRRMLSARFLRRRLA
ncbi:acyltransferase family protein [Altererythrobacter salegens]|uniref:Acyltransferase family protein n=1 Tax=Croceibacterium salegens TaxID=1737568 RepID=A0A6I4T1V8_9SPHN|nr:acyltransferase [Croceibacterium salegens]MXO61330.1 acyltransferase family protein [Croceibacterium salegens]